jgi:hypothetical protein
MWPKKNPCNGVKIPLHDKTILVWYANTPANFIGPYFFQKTVNQRNYLELLKTFFLPIIKDA